ncbi:MAG: hypothetical protein ACRCUY_08720 [Thermoguttaceae bacterium]
MPRIGRCVDCGQDVYSWSDHVLCPHCDGLYCNECSDDYYEMGEVIACNRCNEEFVFGESDYAMSW